jgi:hypothetical protein
VTPEPVEPDADAGQIERWYALATTFVAPATLVSALLFYFGYVSSRARYAYFGIDVDTIGLSTRDFIMRSPQALLVPLLVIALGGAVLLLGHAALQRRGVSQRTVNGALIVAAAVLFAGLVLLFGFPVFGDFRLYNLVTPLLIATGAALLAYAGRWRRAAQSVPRDTSSERTAIRGSVLLALVVVATCLFWATATIAEWAGLGAAMRSAREPEEFRRVIVDTHERLYLTDGIVEEFVLDQEEGQTFRYRYRELRLLVQGSERMFLIPSRWSESNSTIVVPLDGSVRIQFRFDARSPYGAERGATRSGHAKSSSTDPTAGLSPRRFRRPYEYQAAWAMSSGGALRGR